MQVFHGSREFTLNCPVVLALGNFDGVHLGHQKLLRVTRDLAGKIGACPGVYTFWPHPLEVLQGKQVKYILPLDERLKRFAAEELEFTVLESFTPEYARLSPGEFINMLLENFNLAGVVAGFNYTFGHLGAGRVTDLIKAGERFGFKVEVVEPVTFGQEVVSSTAIREKLAAGDIAKVNGMLGYTYFLKGKVIGGDKLARKIGFPTANILPEENLVLPQYGVYRVDVEITGEEVKIPGIANLGVRPTVKVESRPLLEVHLLNYKANLYHRELKVSFLKKIRPEKKFNSLEELKKQIELDVKEALQGIN
ncbi:bifunctional riboflavin kinase/FAD synthetase [Carboxydothermus hydrogenoformans]|uniref:Riboflavin biosynthesis protein n=1 Tax=Carboxydothermus hydrogenoformans (strain ATCC BAA-161 / DSM 6008 / Z-2901) TaxID=246194 RepID=Q3ABA2_CARHZ|nr:bifunctional riboflavin kinase/FAD synthetase [Carboxydothermus hydrogenoformans]ABB15307.1 riboflavin biosynthesis protein RibF [Carboxydothermus hydrogenoformans Z-2901]